MYLMAEAKVLKRFPFSVKIYFLSLLVLGPFFSIFVLYFQFCGSISLSCQPSALRNDLITAIWWSGNPFMTMYLSASLLLPWWLPSGQIIFCFPSTSCPTIQSMGTSLVEIETKLTLAFVFPFFGSWCVVFTRPASSLNCSTSSLLLALDKNSSRALLPLTTILWLVKKTEPLSFPVPLAPPFILHPSGILGSSFQPSKPRH